MRNTQLDGGDVGLGNSPDDVGPPTCLPARIDGVAAISARVQRIDMRAEIEVVSGALTCLAETKAAMRMKTAGSA